MKNFIGFVFLILLFACSNGQKANVILAEKQHERIYKYDFKMFTNHIYLPSFLNDTLPIYLMMDCAANYIYIDSVFAENYYGNDTNFFSQIHGIGNEGSKKIKAYSNSKINICNKERNYEFTLAPNLRRTFGDKIDGIIGGAFLRNYIWFFNFEYNEFELSEILPDSIRQNWKKIPLLLRDNKYYIEANIILADNLQIEGKLIFDTGYGATVAILNDYVKKYQLDTLNCNKLQVTNYFSGASGRSSRYEMKGVKMTMNDLVIERPIIYASLDEKGSLSKGKEKDVIGYIGANALKLMNHVVIDFPGKAIYYSPNEKAIVKDVPHYSTGLGYIDNKISDIGYPITTISADLDGKFTPNDFIMKVNGISVFDSTLSMKKIYAENKKITYTLWQNGSITELTLPIIKIE